MVKFSIELSGKCYEVKGEVVEGEKRTRNYPGCPPYVEVDYDDLTEKVGRDLSEYEIDKVESYAQDELQYIPNKEDLIGC
ncbi:MAG: hypothetical protein ACOC5T_00550 [Elusimicrobiota bacterium]